MYVKGVIFQKNIYIIVVDAKKIFVYKFDYKVIDRKNYK